MEIKIKLETYFTNKKKQPPDLSDLAFIGTISGHILNFHFELTHDV